MNELVQSVEKDIQEEFKKQEEIELYNSNKVLNAFKKYQISEAHLNGTTGYGYNDIGREAIEKIYSDIFETEDALVRMQFISGTHTISTVLFGILRPGDIVLSINGKPYDTLDEVLGIRENPSSLVAFGVKYEQIDLVDNKFNLKAIKERVLKKDVKLVIIQRSRGYAYRNAFLIDELEEKNIITKQENTFKASNDNMMEYEAYKGKWEGITYGYTGDWTIGTVGGLFGVFTHKNPVIQNTFTTLQGCSETLTASGYQILGNEIRNAELEKEKQALVESANKQI